MDKKDKPSDSDPFVLNVDYYIENGNYVFTTHYLKKRGYCCGNGCRHCPYLGVKGEEKEE